ncbi:MAG: transglycosylase SLT domain-containing protein, partial [Gammaproteobacteria bacterium]|nr:transglycosylase SLT domain-containing protein [Gammaproteobacteria bacterium]
LSRDDILPPVKDEFEAFSVRTQTSILDTVISHKDWDLAQQLFPILPETERETEKWRYWRGIINQQLAQESPAVVALQELAQERQYYGFLAALATGQPSQLNLDEAVISEEDHRRLLNDRRVQIVLELFAIGDSANARTEWRYLQQSLTEQERLVIVKQFADLGLTYDAIYSASDAGANDALEVRFPQPYLHEFRRHSHQTNVPIDYLFGIARQESAFNPSAVSPVGARGLMQLMPRTAEGTATRLRISKPSSSSLLLPHINIRLGAHHVAELMDDFGQNRILVAAAYNAGSSNVRRWLQNNDAMNTTSWIERIPYHETRSYVKSVLAFSHVYALMMGIDKPIIAKHELVIPGNGAY